MGFSARLFAMLFSVLLAALGPARAAAPLAVIPYKVTSEGAVAIDVTINGHGPYPFVIDTGATLTIAFENLARRENFQAAERPQVRVLGISGARFFSPFEIGEIRAGTTLAREHVGVVLPDWEAPRDTPAGVIGLDILERFALAFDVRAKTLTLYERGGLPDDLTKRMRTAPIRRPRFAGSGARLYAARGRVNGEPIEFIVDLGIATTLINYAAGDAMLANSIVVAPGRAATTGSRIEDVFDDRTRANAGRFRSVSVGRQRWANKVLWVYDAPLFDELGVKRLAYGLLGADLLTTQDFAIDFSKERLYFSR